MLCMLGMYLCGRRGVTGESTIACDRYGLLEVPWRRQATMAIDGGVDGDPRGGGKGCVPSGRDKEAAWPRVCMQHTRKPPVGK